jgi:SAM-dependent methyltransferase
MSRAFFDQLAPKRARDARRHGEFYRDRVRWLSRILRHDASVVDVGCGVGSILAKLPHTKKTGIDFSPQMIERAKEHDHGSNYIVDDVEQLSYAQLCDAVLLLDTINFLQDIESALSGIRAKLCHERTRLVITSYNFLWQPIFLLGELLRWKTRFPEQNWLQRSDIENLLVLTGFEVVERGQRILCPFYVPLLSHFCNTYLSQLPLLRLFCMVQTTIARPLPQHRTEYSVTVLSAVRNEKGNIQKIADMIPAMGSHTELLFAEGHSTDGTWEEIERIAREHKGPVQIRGVKQPGTGKADALHCGARASHGDIIIVYDGDFTVHPGELPKLYDALSSGRAEFVNASRLVYPLAEGAMRLLNLIGNKVFSMLFSWLFSQHLTDSLSPVKAFFRADYERMHTRMDPFGDFDFFLGGSQQHLKMREIPVHYLPRTYGQTKIRRFHHGWLLFKMFLHGAKKLRWI